MWPSWPSFGEVPFVGVFPSQKHEKPGSHKQGSAAGWPLVWGYGKNTFSEENSARTLTKHRFSEMA